MLAAGFFDGLGVVEISVLIGLVVPLFVALVTKSSASGTVKGVVLAVLATAGAVVAWITGDNAPDDVTLGGILRIGVPVFVTAVAAYFGLYKSVLKVDEKVAPDFGIGGDASPGQGTGP